MGYKVAPTWQPWSKLVVPAPRPPPRLLESARKDDEGSRWLPEDVGEEGEEAADMAATAKAMSATAMAMATTEAMVATSADGRAPPEFTGGDEDAVRRGLDGDDALLISRRLQVVVHRFGKGDGVGR